MFSELYNYYPLYVSFHRSCETNINTFGEPWNDAKRNNMNFKKMWDMC